MKQALQGGNLFIVQKGCLSGPPFPHVIRYILIPMKMHFRGKALLERRAFPRTTIPKNFKHLPAPAGRWTGCHFHDSW